MGKTSLVLEIHHGLSINPNFPYERIDRISRGLTVMNRYFDVKRAEAGFKKCTELCYLPILKTLDEGEFEGFMLSLVLTGTFLELASKYAPKLIEHLNGLVKKGVVELISTPYYHSIASLSQFLMKEFLGQVLEHRAALLKLFGVEPKSFTNTGMIYNDAIGRLLADKFSHILAADGRGGVFKPYGGKGQKLLVRHHDLSEALEVGLFDPGWSGYSLDPEGYASRLRSARGTSIIVVDMREVARREPDKFVTFLLTLAGQRVEWVKVSEVDEDEGELSVPEVETISRYDGSSPWLKNELQRICFHRLVSMLPYVMETKERAVLRIYRLIQDADNFIQMVGPRSLGFFSAYNSVITDFEGRVAAVAYKARSKGIGLKAN